MKIITIPLKGDRLHHDAELIHHDDGSIEFIQKDENVWLSSSQFAKAVQSALMRRTKPVEEKRLWDVWCEGYSGNGDQGTAWNMGSAMALTFAEACQKVVDALYDAHLFDKDKLTFWACRLFPTEREARKSYG